MKLSKIKIVGMHSVESKTYDMDDLNYLIGKNGAGKSTVLQAIQLALLGYIPGYDKTNSGIMKHANGPVLSVRAILEDGNNTVQIDRTWTRSGTSVKSDVSTDPAEYDIESVLADLELPIFNFDEFKSMSANKLKEWFISFLPSTGNEINWVEELSAAVPEEILNETFLDETVSAIEELPGEGVEKCKAATDYLKEQQSFLKGQLTRLDSTLQSLIYYDECENIDEEQLMQDLASIDFTTSELIKFNSYKAQVQRIQDELVKYTTPAESYYSDSAYIAHNKQLVDAQAANDDLQGKLNELMTAQSDIQGKIREATAIKSNVCSYTGEACEKIAAMISSKQEGLDGLESKNAEIATQLADLSQQIKSNDDIISNASAAMRQISAMYERADFLRSQLPKISAECPTTKTEAELAADRRELQDLLAKVKANAQYKALQDNVAKEKYEAELQLSHVKEWIKVTGPNGLQSTLMDKPFELLTEQLTKYLRILFNDKSIEAKFNLVNKANSFSFGVNRDKTYIEYDLLSSGEKCLYTLAMMICLIEDSNSSLKMILVDDLLDHLDDDNGSQIFEALASIKDIQFILAGVKPCNMKKICKEVV